MNEITKRSDSNVAPLRPNDVNPFQSYGEQTTQRNIVGKLLKFTKGEYVAGENNEEIEEGSQFVAVMDELLIGWIHWEAQRPTEHVMGKIAQSYQPPRRGDLGENDREQWEMDATGMPRDPWQFSNYLLLKSLDPDIEGEDSLYTFTTSSRGGLNAVGLLCKKYGGLARMHPNEYPVIELGVGSYNHNDFGKIKYPTFEIVGWVKKSVVTDGLAVLPETLDESDAEPEPKPVDVKATKPARQTRVVKEPEPAARVKPKTRF